MKQRLLVAVILILGIGCAQNKGGDGIDACVATPLSPSCGSSNSPPTGGHLTVPTEETRPSNETDPNTPFPGRFSLTHVSPNNGKQTSLPIRFGWGVSLTVDQLQNDGEGVSFEVLRSDDGVNPIGNSIGGGVVYSGQTKNFTNTTNGGVTMVETPFKYILIKAKWGRSGVGWQYATLTYQVDY